jgi:hypothetical protein
MQIIFFNSKLLYAASYPTLPRAVLFLSGYTSFALQNKKQPTFNIYKFHYSDTSYHTRTDDLIAAPSIHLRIFFGCMAQLNETARYCFNAGIIF